MSGIMMKLDAWYDFENIPTEQRPGIYEIYNRISGKSYIGQTCNLNRRLRRHRSLLKNGGEHNKHLQAAFDKYGIAAFSFRIIEFVENTEDLTTAETRIIKRYAAKDLYNQRPASDSNFGFRHSEASRKKMSEGRKGIKFSETHKENLSKSRRGTKNQWYGKSQHPNLVKALKTRSSLRKVNQIEIKTGETITKFDSIADAARMTGITPANISACARGERKSAGGFKWAYANRQGDTRLTDSQN